MLQSKSLLTFREKILSFLCFPCILKAEKHWIKVTLVNFGQLSREVTGQFKGLAAALGHVHRYPCLRHYNTFIIKQPFKWFFFRGKS